MFRSNCLPRVLKLANRALTFSRGSIIRILCHLRNILNCQQTLPSNNSNRTLQFIKRECNFPCIVRGYVPPSIYICTWVRLCETNTHFTDTLSLYITLSAGPRYPPWRLSLPLLARSHLAQLIQNVFIRDTSSLSREQALPVAAPKRSRPFHIIALFIVPNQSADISIYTQTVSFSTLFLYPPLIHPSFALLRRHVRSLCLFFQSY